MVVTTVAVPQEWLTETYRVHLQREFKRSIRLVGLVRVGQLDPYEDREVAEGLLEVLHAAALPISDLDGPVVGCYRQNSRGGTKAGERASAR